MGITIKRLFAILGVTAIVTVFMYSIPVSAALPYYDRVIPDTTTATATMYHAGPIQVWSTLYSSTYSFTVNGGNVGIGTSDVSSRLNIWGPGASRIFYASTSTTGETAAFTVTNNGNIGIGTNSTSAKLHIYNDGGIIAEGSVGSGATLGLAGPGTKFIWYPRKAAIRAGYDAGSEWDDANIGLYSVAFGEGSRASGEASVACNGFSNLSSGMASFLGAGGNNTASGGYSVVGGGNQNEASGYMSTIPGGYRCTASGNYSFSAGYRAIASGLGSFALTDSQASNFTVAQSSTIGMRFAGGYWLTGGSVGIGNTNPQGKLDIMSDKGGTDYIVKISSQNAASIANMQANGNVEIGNYIKLYSSGTVSANKFEGLLTGSYEGMVSSLTVNSVYPEACLTATYPKITIPAANVAAGSLLTTVVCSSIAANGVWTDAIQSSAVTDAKINDVAPGKISAGAMDADVIVASITTNAVFPEACLAATYPNITINAAKIAAGTVGNTVIVSSVGAGTVGNAQLQSNSSTTAYGIWVTSALYAANGGSASSGGVVGWTTYYMTIPVGGKVFQSSATFRSLVGAFDIAADTMVLHNYWFQVMVAGNGDNSFKVAVSSLTDASFEYISGTVTVYANTLSSQKKVPDVTYVPAHSRITFHTTNAAGATAAEDYSAVIEYHFKREE